MQAIILAGGFGTRLREALSHLPKPMAPIAGEPLLAHSLRHLQRNGVTEVMIALHHMAPAIMLHFGDAFEGLKINYAIEKEALGTGGALHYALSLMRPDAPVLAMNGDTFLALDVRSMLVHHHAAGRPLTIAARSETDCSRYGQMTLNEAGYLTSFHYPGKAAPGFVSTGCYILNPDIFTGHVLPERFSFEADFKTPNITALKPAAYVTDAYFIDIGVPESYARAQMELPARLKLMPA